MQNLFIKNDGVNGFMVQSYKKLRCNTKEFCFLF